MSADLQMVLSNAVDDGKDGARLRRGYRSQSLQPQRPMGDCFKAIRQRSGWRF